jgi:hypothetical protein
MLSAFINGPELAIRGQPPFQLLPQMVHGIEFRTDPRQLDLPVGGPLGVRQKGLRRHARTIAVDPIVDGLLTDAYDLCYVLDCSPSGYQSDGLQSLVSPHHSDLLESVGEVLAIRPPKPQGCRRSRYSHENSLLSKNHF